MQYLKDFCNIITKGTTPSTYGFSFEKTGIKFIRSENINNSRRISKTNLYISNKANEKLKRSVLMEGDVLMSIAGAYLGKLAVIDKSALPANTNQAVAILRTDSSKLNPLYLYYYLSSDKIQNYINNVNAQSAQPNINLQQIGDIILNVPVLEYQQHIVDIIGSIDDKIENNQKLIDRLEKKVELLFDNLYYNAINSNNYKMCKLKDYVKTIITGTTPSTKEDKYWGNDINFITIPDMQNNIFIINTERKLANSVKTKFSSRIISKNTLIVSCIATVGLVSIVLKTSLTNQQINSIIFHNEKDVYFFYQYFKKIKDYLIQLGSGGSATLNINKNAFSNIKVKIPNSKLLTYYLNKVEIIYNYISNIQRENLKLINLKQLYLKKFFR